MVMTARALQAHAVKFTPMKSRSSLLAASFAWLLFSASISSGHARRNTATALPILASHPAIKRIWQKPIPRDGVSAKHQQQKDLAFGDKA